MILNQKIKKGMEFNQEGLSNLLENGFKLTSWKGDGRHSSSAYLTPWIGGGSAKLHLMVEAEQLMLTVVDIYGAKEIKYFNFQLEDKESQEDMWEDVWDHLIDVEKRHKKNNKLDWVSK